MPHPADRTLSALHLRTCPSLSLDSHYALLLRARLSLHSGQLGPIGAEPQFTVVNFHADCPLASFSLPWTQTASASHPSASAEPCACCIVKWSSIATLLPSFGSESHDAIGEAPTCNILRGLLLIQAWLFCPRHRSRLHLAKSVTTLGRFNACKE